MAARRVPAVRTAVETMKDEGVHHVFGCAGPTGPALSAAVERAAGIDLLRVRSVQGATHMAGGWARTLGTPGVALVPSGPEALHLLGGLYAARADAVPLVCVTEHPAPVTTRSSEHADTCADCSGPAPDGPPPVDTVELARPVTKWAVRIEDADRVPGVFRKAFRIARQGCPGPVLIDLPASVAGREIAWRETVRGDIARGDAAGDRPPVAFSSGAPVPFSSSVSSASCVSPAFCVSSASGAPRASPSSGDGALAAAPGLPVTAAWLHRDLAELFGPDAYVVAESHRQPPDRTGRQARTGHQVHAARQVRGRSGVPGWELPAAAGVRVALGTREAEVVAVVDGHGLRHGADALAVAVRYGLPYVLVVLNGVAGPAPARGRHVDDLAEDAYGTDHLRLAAAHGCPGRRVADPAELRAALLWARKEAVSVRRPVVIELL
ncbi:thiamine pyrophosphate-binding protein [Streptomyces sp. NPDC003077]|uniref:thiamine pyrophosphate-binding protein n=1 Tax=Streptomyces sp. NPDC003077 TaxID=3154443 RepID=UPI0033B367DB